MLFTDVLLPENARCICCYPKVSLETPGMTSKPWDVSGLFRSMYYLNSSISLDSCAKVLSAGEAGGENQTVASSISIDNPCVNIQNPEPVTSPLYPLYFVYLKEVYAVNRVKIKQAKPPSTSL
jgi:hypothetical protein